MGRINLPAWELSDIREDVVNGKHRLGDGRKKIWSERTILCFHQAEPTNRFEVSEALNVSGRSELRDTAEGPPRPQKRHLSRINIRWEFPGAVHCVSRPNLQRHRRNHGRFR